MPEGEAGYLGRQRHLGISFARVCALFGGDKSPSTRASGRGMPGTSDRPARMVNGPQMGQERQCPLGVIPPPYVQAWVCRGALAMRTTTRQMPRLGMRCSGYQHQCPEGGPPSH
jgi:hypothetical protein